jgi:hypothetical protein
VTIEL